MTRGLGTVWFVNERNAPSVAEQPVVILRSWRIIETSRGDRHIVAVLDSGSLRMTSPIKSLDPSSSTITTASGRRYMLPVPPELADLPRLLMTANTLRTGLAELTDVSDEVWIMLAQGVEPAATSM